jgi:hypothetical protein
MVLTSMLRRRQDLAEKRLGDQGRVSLSGPDRTARPGWTSTTDRSRVQDGEPPDVIKRLLRDTGRLGLGTP